MSYQTMVNEQLIGSGQLAEGVIIGEDAGIKAKSPGINLAPNEAKELVALFFNPQEAYAKGIPLGGIRYMPTKADNRSIYGRKGPGGVVVVKSNQNIIIGVYDQRHTLNTASVTVEKLGAFLRENGD